MERAIAMHLCPQNAATWRNRTRLPSRAFKFTLSLTAKACGAAGQAASTLHVMAILQVHQAKLLKELHVGSSEPGLIQKLRLTTDFTLRATKVSPEPTARLQRRVAPMNETAHSSGDC